MVPGRRQQEQGIAGQEAAPAALGHQEGGHTLAVHVPLAVGVPSAWGQDHLGGPCDQGEAPLAAAAAAAVVAARTAAAAWVEGPAVAPAAAAAAWAACQGVACRNRRCCW
jgi:hypothetical protein